jgi:hypothetical protein
VLVAEQFQQVREDASDRILVIDSGRLSDHDAGVSGGLTHRQETSGR